MRKFIIASLCLCILVSTFVLPVYSYNYEVPFYDVISDYSDKSIGVSLDVADNDCKLYYKHSIGKQKYSSYDLLDECQKQMYNQIVSVAPGTLSITLNFNNGVFLASNFTKEYLTMVMDAVLLDRTDLFYFAGYSINGGYYYSGSNYIKSLNYQVVMFPNVTYTQSQLSGYYTTLMNTAKSVPVDLSNRYNFVKSVHDYLCDTAYYPDLSSSDYVDNAHDAYGALVEGRTVCQGYSEAFKLICDIYKIPCVCISGTSNGGGHMWNAVQMDDGKWYFLDITWDDQTNKIYYDFFLVGTDSVPTYFNRIKFSESHLANSDNLLPVLDYSSLKYAPVTNATAFKATYNAFADTENKFLVLSAFEAEDTNIFYNGIYLDVMSKNTNTVFDAPSGLNGENEQWTLVLSGDCNGDSYVDVEDFSYCVNLAVSDSSISSAFDKAADADCDGYIDVIDAAIIERAVNGLNTNIIFE